MKRSLHYCRVLNRFKPWPLSTAAPSNVAAAPTSTCIAANFTVRLQSTSSTSIHTSTSAPPEALEPNPNPGIQSVKEMGLDFLQSSTLDIQKRTQQRLLLEDEDTGPTDVQLEEAARLRDYVEEAVYTYTATKGKSTFCILDEPVHIVDVEITEDLRQARIYWSLPFSVLLMDNVPRTIREKAVKKMQGILEAKGGPIQGMVHRKMKMYFRPPILRWVPAEGEMLRRHLKEIHDSDGRL
uniref:Ribosome-binding factor A n=1 Tax=Chaetoceros debilis TaxID=122233 RepID=A0A6S8Z366_9STRA|mmetsp:Transcript_25679/g.37954  ORF Transcript_25679/g.37954 Transcript_25679/m.37954 type:complete len:239 (-) Transcript_25679:819-1535(-)